MLISAYAIGVMVGAPLMTLLLSHRARRNALIFLMAIFTLGNVLSAISPDYTTLMLSRIMTSLNHGAFFGLGRWWRQAWCQNTSRPARWRPCLWG
jgi:DHA1 family inner membrane transport protein